MSTSPKQQVGKSSSPGGNSSNGRLGVNAAFLQEVKDDEWVVSDLIGLVGSSLEVKVLNASQSRTVLAGMRRLHAQLKYRFQLEEVLGYMQDVISVAPRLSNSAETLRGEHAILVDEFQSIVELAHDQLNDDSDSDPAEGLAQIRDRFNSFRVRLAAHESAENDLITESLYFDVGGSE